MCLTDRLFLQTHVTFCEYLVFMNLTPRYSQGCPQARDGLAELEDPAREDALVPLPAAGRRLRYCPGNAGE